MKLAPPPPQNWQDFQDLVTETATIKFKGARNVEQFGREGQDQHGIDVLITDESGALHGIQAKCRRVFLANGELKPNGSFTPTEIDDIILAAQPFNPPLETLIIATTASRDKDLQLHVARGARSRSQTVKFWFWQDFIDVLNRNQQLLLWYCEHVLGNRPEFSLEHMLVELVSVGFSRKAITTPINCENSGNDFVVAIEDNQSALQTGVLVDRITRQPLETAPTGYPSLPEGKVKAFLEEAWQKLDAARNEFAQAQLRKTPQGEPVIVQHPYIIEIRDPALVSRLNALRSEATEAVNRSRQELGLKPMRKSKS